MEGLSCPCRQVPVKGDELLGPGGLAGKDDLVLAEAAVEGQFGRLEGGEDHALGEDLLGWFPEFPVRVLLHLGHDQVLVQRPGVDADADRFPMVHRDLANGGELFVPARAVAHVARIDAVFVQSFGALGNLSQEQVAVVVEVADERSLNPGIEHAPLDGGYGLGGLRHVHRDADHLRARLRQLDTLRRRREDVRRVRVGHGLHHHGRASAYRDAPHPHAGRVLALDSLHDAPTSIEGSLPPRGEARWGMPRCRDEEMPSRSTPRGWGGGIFPHNLLTSSHLRCLYPDHFPVRAVLRPTR